MTLHQHHSTLSPLARFLPLSLSFSTLPVSPPLLLPHGGCLNRWKSWSPGSAEPSAEEVCACRGYSSLGKVAIMWESESLHLEAHGRGFPTTCGPWPGLMKTDFSILNSLLVWCVVVKKTQGKRQGWEWKPKMNTCVENKCSIFQAKCTWCLPWRKIFPLLDINRRTDELPPSHLTRWSYEDFAGRREARTWRVRG